MLYLLQQKFPDLQYVCGYFTYSETINNSLTSAKLPPKNVDGQLKSICVDKKADKINILIEKIIHVIELW